MKTPKTSIKLGHPYVLPVLGVVLLFFIGLTSYVAFSGVTVGAADTRLVTVAVDGSRTTVPTRADTVGELLGRLDVTLRPSDKVNPSIDTPIIEDNQQITVTRARPLSIIDHGVRTIVSTAESSPRAIAETAGYSLFPEDAVQFRQSEERLSEGVVAEEVVITRSVPVTASIYGVIAPYRTIAKTVKDFLNEKSIVPAPDATLQPADPNAPIVANMLIAVNSPGRQTLAVTEPIDFAVEFQNDPSLPAGQTKVIQPGQPGERAIVYEITHEDGQEVGRRELQTVVIKEPVSEIRARGTNLIGNYSVSAEKEALMRAAGIGADQFASVDYIISHESGWRPGAVSANGCIGLGQRCNASILISACPNWQTDPVCQLQHFTGYANGRYGSWNNAAQAWVAQRWW